MSLPSFIGITKIVWEKIAKNVMQTCYFLFKMTAISRNLKQLGPNFALHSGTTQDMSVQSIIGISAKLRALGPEQRFNNTLWILLMRRLQTNQTHIGPKLHVGPKYIGQCYGRAGSQLDTVHSSARGQKQLFEGSIWHQTVAASC